MGNDRQLEFLTDTLITIAGERDRIRRGLTTTHTHKEQRKLFKSMIASNKTYRGIYQEIERLGYSIVVV